MDSQNSGGDLSPPAIKPSGKSHSFDSGIAEAVGVNAAILYNYFSHWVDHNKSQNINFHEGRYWTHNTVKALSSIIPYLTQKEIRNAIDRLVHAGLILQGNFNKNRFNQTKWYSTSEPIVSQLPEQAIPCDPGVNSELPAGAILYNTLEDTLEDSPKGEGASPLHLVSSSPQKKKDPPPPKINFRENVSLTQKEHDTLLADVGEERLNWMLNKLSAHKSAKGQTYKSDAATMRNGGWVRDALESRRSPDTRSNPYAKPGNKMRVCDTGEYSDAKRWEENAARKRERFKNKLAERESR